MTNKEATRYASYVQEKRVAGKLGGRVSSNSGAGMFNKGDIVVEDASLLIECKTCMEPKKSFSIKKDWIDKNKEEAFRLRLDNHVIAFNFDYQDKKDYYIIDDKLMKFLVEKLRKEALLEFSKKLP
jgi:hypothetical protein